MSLKNQGVCWRAIDRRAFLRWLGWGGGTACLAACGTASTSAGKGQKVIVAFLSPTDERTREQNRLDISLKFSYPLSPG